VENKDETPPVNRDETSPVNRDETSPPVILREVAESSQEDKSLDPATDAQDDISRGTRAAQFRAGLKSGLPIFLGYVPVGLAFGILACQHGFYWWEALLASAGAIAGSGQFVALSTLLASGGHAAAALIASSVVNLRYLLFSATVAPHVRKVKPPLLVWLGFSLTDESFAINMAEIAEKKSTPIRMAGVGFISWIGWMVGTLLGALGASFVKNADRFGVNFAMPAMYAALFVALAQNLRQVLCGIGSAAIVIGLYVLSKTGVLVIPTYWFIVIAALLAATIATIIWPHGDEDEAHPDLDADGEATVLEGAAASDEMLVGKRARS